jgi:hypothetical protein
LAERHSSIRSVREQIAHAQIRLVGTRRVPMTSRLFARPSTATVHELGHGPTWGPPRVSPALGTIVVGEAFTGPRSRRRGRGDGHLAGLPDDLDAGRIYTARVGVSGRPTPTGSRPARVHQPQIWLQPGDVIELSIDRVGAVRQYVVGGR